MERKAECDSTDEISPDVLSILARRLHDEMDRLDPGVEENEWNALSERPAITRPGRRKARWSLVHGWTRPPRRGKHHLDRQPGAGHYLDPTIEHSRRS
jgi:hypothetical protein